MGAWAQRTETEARAMPPRAPPQPTTSTILAISLFQPRALPILPLGQSVKHWEQTEYYRPTDCAARNDAGNDRAVLRAPGQDRGRISPGMVPSRTKAHKIEVCDGWKQATIFVCFLRFLPCTSLRGCFLSALPAPPSSFSSVSLKIAKSYLEKTSRRSRVDKLASVFLNP